MGGISDLFATQTPTPRAVPISDGSSSLDDWVTNGSSGGGGGTGDVTGPSSAVPDTLAIYNGSSGKIIKNITGSGVVIQNGSGILFTPFSAIPLPGVIPVSDGSASLSAWVSSGSGGSFDLQAALDALSNVRGSVLFRGASAWQALLPGVPGGYLVTNGSSADPTWSLGDGSGPFGVWVGRVDAAGGTYEPDSKQIAHDFVQALQLESYYSKILWLMPFLGGNLAAARVPLIDVVGAGIASNTGFVNADFSQATGLQGNGTSKVLDSLVPPGASGSQVAGIGWWETNVSITGTDSAIFAVQTTSPDYRWLLDFRSGNEVFAWGPPSGGFGSGSAPTNGHYYAQSNGAADRKLYKNAAQIGSSTSNQPATPETVRTLRLFGNFDGTTYYHNGRCACAYYTDGTMSTSDITAFNTFLQTWLMTPTGR